MSNKVHGADLIVRGTVRNTNCEPVAHAELDVWQTDSDGVYGAIYEGADVGYCRGWVRTDAEGKFELQTQQPGSYGISRMLFGYKWTPDIPPYGPRHIHVVLFSPQYKLGRYQIYFKGDPTRNNDWRAAAAGMSLGATNPQLELDVNDLGEAEFDFVLEPRGVNDTFFKTRQEALEERCLTEEGPPMPGLCFPRAANLMRPETFFGLVLFWIFVAYKALRWCCKKHQKNKMKDQ
jgi:protocatechuate 3,4-dioxygenase beta subunit